MMSLSGIDFRRLMKWTMTRVLVLFIGLGVSWVDGHAEEMRGLVTIGMKRVFEQVMPGFEIFLGRALNIQFASTPEIAERLQKGEAVEFVRRNYDRRAVETPFQRRFVRRFGRPG